MTNDLKLCYVEDNTAYFTSQELSKQWGDDWNDSPYEHNAGTPYCWRKEDGERGIEKYEIVSIEFEGEFSQPRDGHFNSPYSVEEINAGAHPWLSDAYSKTYISAGVSPDEFKRLVEKAHGRVIEGRPLPVQAAA